MLAATYQTDKILNNLREEFNTALLVSDQLAADARLIAKRLADHMTTRVEGSGTTTIEVLLSQSEIIGREWSTALTETMQLMDKIDERRNGLRNGSITCVPV